LAQCALDKTSRALLEEFRREHIDLNDRGG
jgi:hypothetical protein